MKRIVATTIALIASVLFAAAQPAKEPYAPGLGEFMTATQLRHAKLWFAGKQNNWDLAAYEIDEIKEGLEDAASVENADYLARIDELRKVNAAVRFISFEPLLGSVEAADLTDVH